MLKKRTTTTKMKVVTLFTTALIIMSMLFAFGRDTALASFVMNAWQGYKLTDGLVGYWSFDGRDVDLASATAEVWDRSGKGNNGDWKEHATTTTIGKIGQALSFDGVDDVVVISDADDTKYTGAVTLCTWANIRTGGDLRHFMGKHTGNGATNNPFDFRTNNSATPVLVLVRSNSDFRQWNGPAITLLQWKHYCVVAPSGVVTDAPTFYVDGVASLGSGAGGTGSGAVTGSGAAIRIGARADAAAKMNGVIDEVRIYDRALSAEEIKRLYLMGASLKTNVSHRDELTEGLVGNWTFDGKDVEISSSTKEIHDVSGQGKHGDWKNHSTTTTIGKIGQAISFDGVDDNVRIDGVSSAVASGSFTVSLWFKLKNNFSGAQRQNIFVLGDSFSNNDVRVCLGGTPNDSCNAPTGQLCLSAYTGVGWANACATPASWVNETWFHVVGTFSTTSGQAIYVNGSLAGTNVNTSRGGTVALLASLAGYPSTSDDPFNGSVDEVRIYNRALSTEEIKRLYLMGASLKTNVSHRDELTDGLMSNWTFDGKDMTQATATDVSSSGKNGTLTNMAASSSATIGQIGQGLNFSSSSAHYVSVPQNGSYNITSSPFTISLWVKDDAPYGAVSTTFHRFISWYDGTNNAQIGLGAASAPSGTRQYYFTNANSATAPRQMSNFTSGVPLGWHHIVATSAAGGVYTLYVDGVVNQGGTAPSTVGVFTANTTTLYIGQRGDGGSTYTPGVLDDVRIYNRALSNEEVRRLYLMGK